MNFLKLLFFFSASISTNNVCGQTSGMSLDESLAFINQLDQHRLKSIIITNFDSSKHPLIRRELYRINITDTIVETSLVTTYAGSRQIDSNKHKFNKDKELIYWISRISEINNNNSLLGHHLCYYFFLTKNGTTKGDYSYMDTITRGYHTYKIETNGNQSLIHDPLTEKLLYLGKEKTTRNDKNNKKGQYREPLTSTPAVPEPIREEIKDKFGRVISSVEYDRYGSIFRQTSISYKGKRKKVVSKSLDSNGIVIATWTSISEKGRLIKDALKLNNSKWNEWLYEYTYFKNGLVASISYFERDRFKYLDRYQYK